MTRHSCRQFSVLIPGIAALLMAGPLLSASQADFDKRCEDAREKKIAPLRKAEIDKCKTREKRDPLTCETFYSTYGDATGSVNSGAYKPRMFDDLPECVAARNAGDNQQAGGARNAGDNQQAGGARTRDSGTRSSAR